MRWLASAVRHALVLGAEGMPAGPKMAVAGFFIPLFNLMLPFVAMRALWQASIRPADWEAQRASTVVALWWAAWIVAAFANAIALVGDNSEADMPVRIILIANMIAAVALVPAGIALAGIVEAIERRFRALEG